jgi:hypothetical protein
MRCEDGVKSAHSYCHCHCQCQAGPSACPCDGLAAAEIGLWPIEMSHRPSPAASAVATQGSRRSRQRSPAGESDCSTDKSLVRPRSAPDTVLLAHRSVVGNVTEGTRGGSRMFADVRRAHQSRGALGLVKSGVPATQAKRPKRCCS